MSGEGPIMAVKDGSSLVGQHHVKESTEPGGTRRDPGAGPETGLSCEEAGHGIIV